MTYYISPIEIQHWIGKANLHIKHALQEIEIPEYIEQSGTSQGWKLSKTGCPELDRITYSYGEIGLAFELILKTLVISNFKPLNVKKVGHNVGKVFNKLNRKTQEMTKECAQNLINHFKYKYPKHHSDFNIEFILKMADSLMTDVNVKYANVPANVSDDISEIFPTYKLDNLSSPTIHIITYQATRNMCFFLQRLSRLSLGMLRIAEILFRNRYYKRICSQITINDDTSQEYIDNYIKSVFEECSKFMSNFKINLVRGNIVIEAPKEYILKIIDNSKKDRIGDDFTYTTFSITSLRPHHYEIMFWFEQGYSVNEMIDIINNIHQKQYLKHRQLGINL